MERAAADRFALVQKVAVLVGVVFLLIGLLGFIPGITENAPGEFIGSADEPAKLLGLFEISWVHNVVHLLFGVVGLMLARTWEGARNFLIWGGVVYLLLWVLGLVGALDWLPTNSEDHWLHLGLGVGMIGLGFLTTRGDRMMAGDRPAT